MSDLHHVLTSLFPQAPAVYGDVLPKVFDHYQINTVNRQAAFLAQTGHESMGYTHIAENLNYSADGLQKTWPSRFNAVLAKQCERNPEKIANVVYANRMGNGPPESGDGWNFRGRGLIQLTGKDNYTHFGQDCGRSTLRDVISYLETPEGAAMSAGWFWDKNGLNALADKGDILNMTKRINGGTTGLQERVDLYAKAKALLNG